MGKCAEVILTADTTQDPTATAATPATATPAATPATTIPAAAPQATHPAAPHVTATHPAAHHPAVFPPPAVFPLPAGRSTSRPSPSRRPSLFMNTKSHGRRLSPRDAQSASLPTKRSSSKMNE